MSQKATVTWCWILVVGNVLFLALDGPGEWATIIHGVVYPDAVFHWRLSLGLGLKNVLVVGTIVGLLQHREYGQVCLGAESVHSIIIRCGALSVSGEYWPQMVVPVVDIVFRLASMAFIWKLTVQEETSCVLVHEG